MSKLYFDSSTDLNVPVGLLDVLRDEFNPLECVRHLAERLLGGVGGSRGGLAAAALQRLAVRGEAVGAAIEVVEVCNKKEYTIYTIDVPLYRFFSFLYQT